MDKLAEHEEETLKLLGLSHIQAKVYLGLIRSGASSAKTLSKCTDVARPDIYRIMTNFQKLGIAQRTITNPVMFEATPIEQALNILIDYRIKETKNLQKKTQNLIQQLKPIQMQNPKNYPQSEPDLFLMPATRLAIQKRKELIQNAHYSIDIINTWKRYKFFLEFNGLTKKMVKKGIKFRILVEMPEKMKLLPEHQEALKILKENSSSLRYIHTTPSAVVSIYDGKEVLLSMSENAGPHDSPLLWSNNNSIVSMANSYFEKLWKTSTEEPT